MQRNMKKCLNKQNENNMRVEQGGFVEQIYFLHPKDSDGAI